MNQSCDELQAAVRERFAAAAVHGWTGYRTSPYTQGALVSAGKPGPEVR